LPGTRDGGPAVGPETLELLRLYVDRFNRRDWDGVGELAGAEARLRVGNCFAGRLTGSPYFVEYERPIIPRRMAPGTIDGEAVVIILQDDASLAAPLSVIRLGVASNRNVRITDYIKSSWILDAAHSVVIGQP
jgi:RNA polymerase sigma-70 factor (ECF subfamily)